jgi:hypothetical protein
VAQLERRIEEVQQVRQADVAARASVLLKRRTKNAISPRQLSVTVVAMNLAN